MTMTASTSHCWKSARLKFAACLVCACLLWFLPHIARAGGPDSGPPEISQLQVERNADGIFVSATVRFDLPAPVEDALLKGVAMFFVVEADVYRDRWYWYDKKLLSAERHMRLAYHPLTRRWRLNVASGAITNNSLGLALNQNFDSLADALAALRRVSRWKIAEAADIDVEQKHNIELRFKLDVSQLPRPFQIGALGQADWNISATTSQRLGADIAK
jgi:Domain of unknown function (DUF4390)